MAQENKESKIFVFEGFDGSGKTSTIDEIEKRLQFEKYKVIKFREPGGLSHESEEIRKVFLNNDLDTITQILLLFAARWENLFTLQKYPYVDAILIDRFIASTYCYQLNLKYPNILDISLIDILSKKLLSDFQIDTSFYINISKETSIERTKKRGKGDIFSNKLISQYDKIMENYGIYYSKHDVFSKEIVNIDGENKFEKNIEIIYNNILRKVAEK